MSKDNPESNEWQDVVASKEEDQGVIPNPQGTSHPKDQPVMNQRKKIGDDTCSSEGHLPERKDITQEGNHNP